MGDPVDQPVAAREPARVTPLPPGRPRGPFPSPEERAAERERIVAAIDAAGGSRKLAALALGYTVRRLHRRIDALGIDRGDLAPAPPGALPPPTKIPERDPSDRALVAQAVRLAGGARPVARAIGTSDARISLVRAWKARLTDEQRTALEDLLASPPAVAAEELAVTPDGRLLDAACARLGLTMTALAAKLGLTKHHLSRVRHDRAKLGDGARAAVEAILTAEPTEASP